MPIDVLIAGKMHPYENLLRQLDVLSRLPGLYIWLVRVPRGRTWIPVYLGEAIDLAIRLRAYVHKDGTWRPSGERVKAGLMLDLQQRGFSVQVR